MSRASMTTLVSKRWTSWDISRVVEITRFERSRCLEEVKSCSCSPQSVRVNSSIAILTCCSTRIDLFKIIASVKEKEELVAHEILPYSYRSRQIAVVTARSMFRQFGSRVIKDGRRVRDDYWEAKAIKQGFTEQDAAGEKRPGAARAREAAAQDQLSSRATVAAAYGDIVYSNGPAYGAVQPQLCNQALLQPWLS